MDFFEWRQSVSVCHSAVKEHQIHFRRPWVIRCFSTTTSPHRTELKLIMGPAGWYSTTAPCIFHSSPPHHDSINPSWIKKQPHLNWELICIRPTLPPFTICNPPLSHHSTPQNPTQIILHQLRRRLTAAINSLLTNQVFIQVQSSYLTWKLLDFIVRNMFLYMNLNRHPQNEMVNVLTSFQFLLKNKKITVVTMIFRF